MTLSEAQAALQKHGISSSLSWEDRPADEWNIFGGKGPERLRYKFLTGRRDRPDSNGPIAVKLLIAGVYENGKFVSGEVVRIESQGGFKGGSSEASLANAQKRFGPLAEVTNTPAAHEFARVLKPNGEEMAADDPYFGGCSFGMRSLRFKKDFLANCGLTIFYFPKPDRIILMDQVKAYRRIMEIAEAASDPAPASSDPTPSDCGLEPRPTHPNGDWVACYGELEYRSPSGSSGDYINCPIALAAAEGQLLAGSPPAAVTEARKKAWATCLESEGYERTSPTR